MQSIKINGKEDLLPKHITITELLEKKGIKPGEVIVVHNDTVVDRERWPGTLVKGGDTLEILKMLGGG